MQILLMLIGLVVIAYFLTLGVMTMLRKDKGGLND
jgi:hypothetical protein